MNKITIMNETVKVQVLNLIDYIPFESEDMNLAKKLCEKLKANYEHSNLELKVCGKLTQQFQNRITLPLGQAINNLEKCLEDFDETKYFDNINDIQENFKKLLCEDNNILVHQLINNLTASDAYSKALELCNEAADYLISTYEDILHKYKILLQNIIGYTLYIDQSFKQDLTNLRDLIDALYERDKKCSYVYNMCFGFCIMNKP